MNLKIGRIYKGIAQIPILVGLLLMAIAVPAATKLVQENQNTENRAACASSGQSCNSTSCCQGYSCVTTPYGKVCTAAAQPTKAPTSAPAATRTCTTRTCGNNKCNSTSYTRVSSQACDPSNCSTDNDCKPAATAVPPTKVPPTSAPACGALGQNCCFTEYVGSVAVNNKCNDGFTCLSGKCTTGCSSSLNKPNGCTCLIGQQCTSGICSKDGFCTDNLNCHDETLLGLVYMKSGETRCLTYINGTFNVTCNNGSVTRGTSCGSSVTPSPGSCPLTNKALGCSCTIGNQCNSGYCTLGICTQYQGCSTPTLQGLIQMTHGQTRCLAYADGTFNITCNNGNVTRGASCAESNCPVQATNRNNGCGCILDSQCTSGHCVSGYCSANALPTQTTCTSGSIKCENTSSYRTCSSTTGRWSTTLSNCQAGYSCNTVGGVDKCRNSSVTPTVNTSNLKCCCKPTYITGDNGQQFEPGENCNWISNSNTCSTLGSGFVEKTNDRCATSSIPTVTKLPTNTPVITFATVTPTPLNTTCCAGNAVCTSSSKSCCSGFTKVWTPYGYYCQANSAVPTSTKCTPNTWKCEPINANGSNYQIPCTNQGVWDYGAASRCAGTCVAGGKCESIGCNAGDKRCRNINDKWSAEVCNKDKVWAGTACANGCLNGECVDQTVTPAPELLANTYGCGGQVSQELGCSGANPVKVGDKCPEGKWTKVYVSGNAPNRTCRLDCSESCSWTGPGPAITSAITPTSGGSNPGSCNQTCSGNMLQDCVTKDGDGTSRDTKCTTAGQTGICGGANYCCPSANGNWTADMTACGGSTNNKCTQCPGKPNAKSQGDADCNGKTELNDFSIWKSEFVSGDLGSTEKNSWGADFDCDGKVTLNDFSIWKPQYIQGL